MHCNFFLMMLTQRVKAGFHERLIWRHLGTQYAAHDALQLH